MVRRRALPPSTPSRWPTSSTSSCSATARRSSARSPRWSATGSVGGRTEPRRRAARPAPSRRACTSRRCTTWTYDGAGGSWRSRRRYPDVPGDGRQAHRRRPRRLALPEAPARAAHRGGPRPPQRRGVPRLHAWLPLLPGRDDHPARCASAPPTRCARWCADGPAAHGLRRGRPHVAVDGRLLAASRGRRPTSVDRSRRTAGRCQRQPAVAAGRRLHRRRRRPDRRRPAAPGSPSPPRPGTWRLRQVINKLITRGRPLRRGRVGLLARAGRG